MGKLLREGPMEKEKSPGLSDGEISSCSKDGTIGGSTSTETIPSPASCSSSTSSDGGQRRLTFLSTPISKFSSQARPDPDTDIETLTRLTKIPVDDAIKFIQERFEDYFSPLILSSRFRGRRLILFIKIVATKLCAPTALMAIQNDLIVRITTEKYWRVLNDHTKELVQAVDDRFWADEPYRCSAREFETLEYLFVYYDVAVGILGGQIPSRFAKNFQSAQFLMILIRKHILRSGTITDQNKFDKADRRISFPRKHLYEQLEELRFPGKCDSKFSGAENIHSVKKPGRMLLSTTGSSVESKIDDALIVHTTSTTKWPSSSSLFPNFSIPAVSSDAWSSMNVKRLRMLLRLSTDGAILYLENRCDSFSNLLSSHNITDDNDFNVLIELLGNKLCLQTKYSKIQSRIITIITTPELVQKLLKHVHQLLKNSLPTPIRLIEIPHSRFVWNILNYLLAYCNFALSHLKQIAAVNNIHHDDDDDEDDIQPVLILLQNIVDIQITVNAKVFDLNKIPLVEKLFSDMIKSLLLESDSELASCFGSNDLLVSRNSEEPKTKSFPKIHSSDYPDEGCFKELLPLENNRPDSVLDSTSVSINEAHEIFQPSSVKMGEENLFSENDLVELHETIQKALQQPTKFHVNSKIAGSLSYLPAVAAYQEPDPEPEKNLVFRCKRTSSDVLGLTKNYFFINHHLHNADTSESKASDYEARYVVNFCRHLVLQGYEPSQITLLAMFNEQKSRIRMRVELVGNALPALRLMNLSTLDINRREENDLVIWSLAPVDAENNLELRVDTENLLTKALPKARLGLYIIGNIEHLLLSSDPKILCEIHDSLQKEQSIGSELGLECKNHGEVSYIQNYKDFRTKAPEGGCSKRCNSILPSCEHLCGKYCHTLDLDHANYECQALIDLPLNCGHPIKIHCYMETETRRQLELGLLSIACDSVCDAKLDCGHLCKKKCHFRDDPNHEKYKCREQKECERKCEKNHACPSDHMCFQHCEPCKVTVTEVLPCGHELKKVACHKLTLLKSIHTCEQSLKRKKSLKNCNIS